MKLVRVAAGVALLLGVLSVQLCHEVRTVRAFLGARYLLEDAEIRGPGECASP